MGKKNKKQAVNNDAKSPDKTKPQGGSAIVKGKPQNAVTNKQNNKSPQKGAQPNQKAANKPTNKNVNAPKIIPDEKLQVAAAAVAAKSGKKKNKNKKKTGATNGDVKKDDNVAKPVDTPKTDSPVVLTKRDKSRLKSEINREIILKGKSKLGLADPKLVAKKLAKLKNKAEPHSKKAQRKILLLDSLLKRLTKGQKLDTKKEIDETEAIMNGSDSDSSDDDEKMSEDDGKPKVNGKNEPATPAKIKKIEYTVFVGGLPETITKEAVKEHFQQAGVVIKAKVPPPKKKKSNKRFAYVQLIDEPARQKALQLHGTMIADKKISVLYADKSKGRKELMSLNAKLGASRKSETEKTPGSPPSNEKTTKNKNKKKGNKKSPFLK